MIRSILKHKTFNFPAGEMHVVVYPEVHHYEIPIDVTFEFKKTEDIIELMLFCNALQENGLTLGCLCIPYVPFARQDRVATTGDCFSLRVFSNIINGFGSRRVTVYDPHSYVTAALIKNIKIITQADLLAPFIVDMISMEGQRSDSIVVVAPDAGASHKALDVAARARVSNIVSCFKHRNPKTGEITGTVVQAPNGYLNDKICIIVDDICDGGRTFIEIAKTIRANNTPRKIILMVTHGLFTKGFKVFDGLIDEIYTYQGKHCVSGVLSQETMERRAV